MRYPSGPIRKFQIQEVATSYFKLLFFISVRLSGPKLCPFKIDIINEKKKKKKKTGNPLIFAQ